MPRIYSRCSDPYDYCLKCFPKTEAAARAIHGHDGDGPDGRGDCFGYDDEHPGYDGEDQLGARHGRYTVSRSRGGHQRQLEL